MTDLTAPTPNAKLGLDDPELEAARERATGDTEHSTRAYKAMARAQQMRPGLQAFARALTGEPALTLKIWGGSASCTDGEEILISPPMELGDDVRHTRTLCSDYDELGLPRCPGCRASEKVLRSAEHEIGHITQGSFSKGEKRKLSWLLNRAAEWLEQRGQAEGFKPVREGLDENYNTIYRCRTREEWRKEITNAVRRAPSPTLVYLNCAIAINPWLKVLWNGLEDGRVNNGIHRVRPGSRRYFRGGYLELLKKGILLPDGTRLQYSDREIESQLAMAVTFASMGYGFDLTDHFDPEVIDILADPQVRAVIERAATAEGMAECFDLARDLLGRLQAHGYMADPPPPELPTLGDPSDDDNDDSEASSERSDQHSERTDELQQPEDDEREDSDDADDRTRSERDPDPEETTEETTEGEPGEPSDPDDEAVPVEDDDAGSDADDASEGEPEEPGPTPDSSDSAAADGDDSDDSPDEGDSDTDDGEDELGDGSSADSGDVDGEAGSDDGLDGEADADGSESESDSDSAGSTPADQPGSGSGESAEDDDADCAGDESSDDDSEAGTGTGSGLGGGSGSALGEGSEDDEDSWPEEAEEEVEPGPTAREIEQAARRAQADLDIATGHPGENNEEDYEDPMLGNWLGSEDPDPEMPDPEENTTSDEYSSEGSWGEGSEELEVAHTQHEFFRAPSKEVGRVNVLRLDDSGRQDGAWGRQYVESTLLMWQHLNEGAPNVFWNREHFAGIKDRDQMDAVVQRCLNQARLVFTENRAVRRQRNLPYGRLATGAGPKLKTGNVKVFGRRTRPDSRDYAVLIGLDISGSTGNGILVEMKQAAYAQAELLHRLGIKFAFYCHTSMRSKNNYSTVDLDLVEIKSFDEQWNDETRARLDAAMSSGGNIDGHTLQTYRKLVEREQATDRLILYYTDGAMPLENYAEELEILRYECKLIERTPNLNVLAVGAQTDSPKQHGLETVRLDSPEDLPSVVDALKRKLL